MNYNVIRRRSRKVKVGGLYVGGDSRLTVQSMTNTDTFDTEATVGQVRALANAGCDIVRITVPNEDAAHTVQAIKATGIKVPIVADIHFDWKAAIASAVCGADKIRINPGNIGSDDKVREVCAACSDRGIPIRIGVNSGSLEKNVLKKYGAPTPEALAESALYHAGLLEKFGFSDIVVSIKSTSVPAMIAANRILAHETDYPLHLGVTEAGLPEAGIVKSAIGIGSLLCDGIGDTLRVSLTGDPVQEVAAARRIISAIGIEGQSGMNIISCPTCGRTKIDLPSLASRFTEAVREEGLDRLPISVALMGCAVNGPGEAREADIGIAGGIGEALLFEKGEIIMKIKEEDVVNCLIGRIKERYSDGKETD